MLNMRIILDGENSLPELAGKKLRRIEDCTVVALPVGMSSGRASMAFIAELADGSYVFIENSMVNFIRAAIAFHAQYEKEWRDQGVTLEVTPYVPGTE